MQSARVGAHRVVLGADELGTPMGGAQPMGTTILHATVTVTDAATGAAVSTGATLTGNDALDVQASGSASADITASEPGVGVVTATPALPGAEAQTAKVRVYPALWLGDHPEWQSNWVAGARMSDGAPVEVIAGADVYLTSPNFAEGDEHLAAGYTLHFPGGVMPVDEEKMGAPLTVGTRDWSTAGSEVQLSDNPFMTPSPNTRFLVRDLAGQVYKLKINFSGGSTEVGADGKPVPGTAIWAPELWLLPAKPDGTFDY